MTEACEDCLKRIAKALEKQNKLIADSNEMAAINLKHNLEAHLERREMMAQSQALEEWVAKTQLGVGDDA